VAKVLLVDDEQLVRKVVKVVLEAEGHEVVEAGNGPEALASVRGGAPDVVVLDLMMPGEDGLATCRHIKAHDKAIRVLVLTSVPEAEAHTEADEAGADGFMVKPFSSLDLLDRVSALLGP
jgi:DNA-binding response OmpR family regulator